MEDSFYRHNINDLNCRYFYQLPPITLSENSQAIDIMDVAEYGIIHALITRYKWASIL